MSTQTKSIEIEIGDPIPSISTFGVKIYNPNVGAITYAVNGGDAIAIPAGQNVFLQGVNDSNQLAFTGTGDVVLELNVTYEPMHMNSPTTITGTVEYDEVLTCVLGDIYSQETPTTTYQWLRNFSPIANATNATYTLVAADSEKKITVVQQSFNVNGANTTDSATVQVPDLSPVFTTTAEVTGTLEAGETLTCENFVCTNNPDFTYQWYLDDEIEVGETSATIEDVVEGDYYCVVTATNPIGVAESQTAVVTVGP
jgi:hypothetical protein